MSNPSLGAAHKKKVRCKLNMPKEVVSKTPPSTTTTIVTAGGQTRVSLPAKEAERLHEEYKAWRKSPSENAVFEYADEHKHYVLRFDAILYAEIALRKRTITVH